MTDALRRPPRLIWANVIVMIVRRRWRRRQWRRRRYEQPFYDNAHTHKQLHYVDRRTTPACARCSRRGLRGVRARCGFMICPLRAVNYANPVEGYACAANNTLCVCVCVEYDSPGVRKADAPTVTNHRLQFVLNTPHFHKCRPGNYNPMVFGPGAIHLENQIAQFHWSGGKFGRRVACPC